MSHTNYNKMFVQPEEEVDVTVDVESEVIDEPITEADVEPENVEEEQAPIAEAKPETTEPTTVKATIIGCTRLNVRKEPNPDADVMTILNVSSEVDCVIEPVGNYYKIFTAEGIEGYCVKDYLKLK